MQKLRFINGNGVEIDFTSGNYGITEWEGFSANELEIQTQQVPMQDGAVFLDALYNQRQLSIILAIQDNNDLEKRYRLRRELISVLNAKLGEGTLIYKNDFLEKQIKVIPQLPVFENHNSNDAGTPKASISFNACNPYWEDVLETVISFNIEEQPEIENTGDLPAQLEMDWITNEVVNPKVTNIATNHSIEYKGELTENLSINTNFGKKEVVTNKINYSLAGLLGDDINELIYIKEKNLFIAVGNNGLILISKDLQKWESVDKVIPTIYDVPYLKTVCYSKERNLIIAGGSYGTYSSSFVLISKDGINWERGNTNSPIRASFNKIIYVETQHLFYGFTQEGTYTTQDGKSWSKIDNNAFIDVVYSEFLQLYIGIKYTSILTSQDCITWTSQIDNLNQLTRIFNLEEKQKILIGANNIIYSSSNGSTWNNEAVIGLITGFAYSKDLDKVYAVPNSLEGSIYTSDDGTNWSEQDININESLTIKNLYFSEEKGLFTMIGNVILESLDSENWQNILSQNTNTLNDIIYVRKKFIFVAVGNQSILKSEDGYNWNNCVETNNSINSICYSNEKDIFIAVGSNAIYKSNDGSIWNELNFNGITFNKVIYNSKIQKFIAVGNNDVIYTSEDGDDWQAQDCGLNNYDIISIDYNINQNLILCFAQENYTNGVQVIIGSSNGEDWEIFKTLENRNTINYFNFCYVEKFNKYYLAGSVPSTMFSTPQIKSSADLNTWTNLTIPSTLQNVSLGNSFYYSKNLDRLLIGGAGVLLSCSDGDTLLYEGYIGINNNVYSIKDYSSNIILCAGSYILNSTTQESRNKIDKISENSDMNLNLIVGENKLRINYDSGNMDVILRYRQKYLGV